MGSCQFYYERFKHVKKQLLSSQVVDKQLKTSQILLSHIQDDTSQNLVFSVEKKFGFQHHFNTENDRVWPGDGTEGSRVVRRKRCVASLMFWEAVAKSGESTLSFVCQGCN